jgi:hypothetical protein
MRVDKNNPQQIYNNFLDWVFTDWQHTILLLSLVIAYLFYLMTTEEV